ncbi:MAG TPA: hypothetical protein VK611_00215 [Acidimicrobiales bacterium]|nr:hypothetical protein [Acidimicrobiales bacterium]
MTDGWGPDDAPRLHPLTYPGRWPEHSVLLTHASHHRLDPASLDEALADRTPVLAVGSNASPAQLRYKYADADPPWEMPLVLADVEGLAPGFTALVTSAGYVPATPVLGSHLRSRLFVQWLDDPQLALLDATEPGYRRTPVDARITLPSGRVLDDCDAYVADRGVLVDAEGAPRWLCDQRSLLTQLLRESERLRAVMGDTPDEWIERSRRREARRAADEILVAEGWVRNGPL